MKKMQIPTNLGGEICAFLNPGKEFLGLSSTADSSEMEWVNGHSVTCRTLLPTLL